MFFHLLIHELKRYFKSKQELINIYSLFMIILLLHVFGNSASSIKYQEVAPLVSWVALAISMMLGVHNLYERDYANGVLEHYQSSRVSLSGVIAAKWTAYYIFITVPLVAFLPVLALLVDIPVSAWSRYSIGLMVGAMPLSLLSALIAAAMVGLEKIGALVGLVVMPLYIPVVIFGVSYLHSEGSLMQPQLLFMGGLSLILFPILCLAGASCIRASH